MPNRPPFLTSVLTTKCPRCREGQMFESSTAYSTRFADMRKSCACCGQAFEPEPGFYYGAMYVSFGFNVAIFLAAFLLLSQLVEEVSMGLMIGVVAAAVVIFLPVIFRLSRAIWINIFVRYEGASSQILRKTDR